MSEDESVVIIFLEGNYSRNHQMLCLTCESFDVFVCSSAWFKFQAKAL